MAEEKGHYLVINQAKKVTIPKFFHHLKYDEFHRKLESKLAGLLGHFVAIKCKNSGYFSRGHNGYKIGDDNEKFGYLYKHVSCGWLEIAELINYDGGHSTLFLMRKLWENLALETTFL